MNGSKAVGNTVFMRSWWYFLKFVIFMFFHINSCISTAECCSRKESWCRSHIVPEIEDMR